MSIKREMIYGAEAGGVDAQIQARKELDAPAGLLYC